MSVELECEPVRTACIRLRLIVGLADVELHASFFSDALEDVAGAVEALLRGHPAPRVILIDAPVEYRWLFEGESGSRVRVRILEFPDYPSGRRDDEGRTLLDATCGLADLAGAVVSCLTRLQVTYGPDGFEDLARMQLPMRRREAIERLLRGA